MRPSARTSPSPDTPSASAETMSGSTSTKRSRRKILPAGSVTRRTNVFNAGASPNATCAITPSTTPSASPASIRYEWWNRMGRQYCGAGESGAIFKRKHPAARKGPPMTTSRSTLLLAVLSLLASAAHAQVVPTGMTVEPLATAPSAPTWLDFLPDGRVVYVEQFAARVRVFKPGTGVQATPVVQVAGVSAGGERGLLGVAIDPRYPGFPY